MKTIELVDNEIAIILSFDTEGFKVRSEGSMIQTDDEVMLTKVAQLGYCAKGVVYSVVNEFSNYVTLGVTVRRKEDKSFDEYMTKLEDENSLANMEIAGRA